MLGVSPVETQFEVVTFSTQGKRLDTAEAATAEDALRAGQILFDEAQTGLYGCKPKVGFFDADGKLIRMVDGRPQ